MSSLRLATFHSFRADVRYPATCEIVVDWEKDIGGATGTHWTGPGYSVQEVTSTPGKPIADALPIAIVTGDTEAREEQALIAALAYYRKRKREYQRCAA